MPVDFRNTNTVWASVAVETLSRLGLTTAIACPGSRSTPLTLALAQHAAVETLPILDERSASFFALGVARRAHQPVVLVCTSGTAGANFYSAVIEARESRVPLLILTADRPPELRDCNAGQTIDQQKLFGTYTNWYHEVALPSSDLNALAYLRQTLVHAWERACFPVPGPVHLNFPFRDPLAPLPEENAQALALTFPQDAFFSAIQPQPLASGFALPQGTLPFSEWQTCDRGIVVVGPAQPTHPERYCRAIAQLSQALGWPVLAEGLSPLRNYASLNPYLISTYDLLLRNPQWADKLAPEQVIRIGDMPTSKVLRQWLTQVQSRQWVIDPSDRNLDPLHGLTTHLRCSVEQLASPDLPPTPSGNLAGPQTYLNQWCQREAQIRSMLDRVFNETDTLLEGKAAWLLSQILPPQTPLFIANSMPVRDVEAFWKPSDRQIQPFFNRGANGIDGTVSTALGMAHRQSSSVLLTGDLALLHDTNGFLIRPHFAGHLTILVINNNGGGIFEMLPIAQFEPPFETFFATPQEVDFANLAAAYGITYQAITTWEELQAALQVLPLTGIRLLELKTDRKANAHWRKFELSQQVQSQER